MHSRARYCTPDVLNDEGKGVLGETGSAGSPPSVRVPQSKDPGEAVMSENVEANRARTKERKCRYFEVAATRA